MKRNLLIFFALLWCGPWPLLSAQEAPLMIEKQYLSGQDKDHTVDWDFYCSEGRKSGEWTRIAVPSCWEQQGFGAYNYGHDPMESRAKEYGLYKHRFSIPKDWKQREVKLVFEGVMTDAEVKVNGKLAGEIHQGAFYEFKYSISKLLKFGQENVLEVKANKVSANESINYAERKADFWIFGGIYRPVYLEAFPKQHIERVAIDAQASGAITADVFMQASAAKKITMELQRVNGEKIQDIKVELVGQSKDKWQVKGIAKNIKSWNPEQPNMYQLAIHLKDRKGDVLHTYQQKIGFRTVELLAGDGIYVNGERIKFKGVNRHAFHPSSGRTTSKALSIEHVLMMKDMNMNAVRMSHYPPDVHFLDVCDSLGLFVIDEVCTWHSPHLDTEVGRKIVKETVVRDVNHPSILLWANGNETGWNTELDDDYALWDIQQREVIHPWNIFRKTNTLHYFHYHALANDAYSQDKIFFPTEFLHGLYDGGHGAGLQDYWHQMWHMPTSAGGFLWDFADEAIERTDKGGELDTDGNHAADGIVGPYGEKEGSYFTIKEVWSPIYLEDRYIREGFNGVFRLENRYHFTNLRDCKMEAKWVQFDGPEGSVKPNMLSASKVDLPALEPAQKGKFTVSKPRNWQQADALYLTATDAHGQEIFTWSYPVQTPRAHNSAKVKTEATGDRPGWKKEGDQYVVSAGEMVYRFSASTGILKEVKSAAKWIPLHEGPVILEHKDKIDSIFVQERGDQLQLVTVYEATDKTPAWAQHVELSSDRIVWTISPDGLLDLEVEIKSKRRVKGFKGISFSFPEEQVQGMKWLGDGPYRVWRNRMKGTRFQIWENDYNNTVTGELGFVYPEFKGYFSSLYWAKVKGKNNNGFTVYCHSPFTFLKMLTPEAPSEDPKNRVTPQFPKGDIAFLKNISGVGTKFQTPDSMGPHGNEENYFGNDDDPIIIHLTFDFNNSTRPMLGTN
ncbi:glycoside hydrolase family 2 protein [Persicobacter diffluens]|uniref:beta-galactosidase n=1 Tax=Persicobacter diffluens TaxID=981 RepID=A0AAN4W0Q8_9BACT|nr:beta-galactosidase [Persicobacter diffluens]